MSFFGVASAAFCEHLAFQGAYNLRQENAGCPTQVLALPFLRLNRSLRPENISQQLGHTKFLQYFKISYLHCFASMTHLNYKVK